MKSTEENVSDDVAMIFLAVQTIRIAANVTSCFEQDKLWVKEAQVQSEAIGWLINQAMIKFLKFLGGSVDLR